MNVSCSVYAIVCVVVLCKLVFDMELRSTVFRVGTCLFGRLGFELLTLRCFFRTETRLQLLVRNSSASLMLTWTSKALLCRSRALANSSLQSPSELFYAVLRTRQRTPRCSLKHIHDSARRSLMTVGDENASSAASKSPTARAPYRILFAGADRFSCTSLELLAKQDSSTF